jgi:hypothetical protein
MTVTPLFYLMTMPRYAVEEAMMEDPHTAPCMCMGKYVSSTDIKLYKMKTHVQVRGQLQSGPATWGGTGYQQRDRKQLPDHVEVQQNGYCCTFLLSNLYFHFTF